MSEKIKKYLKNSIDEKGNYCYSLPVETTKTIIKELERLNNIINECLDSTCCIEHNLEKYEEIGLDHFDYALKKTTELKEFLIEELKDSD